MNLPNRSSLFSSGAGLVFAFAFTATEMAAESKVTYSHDIDAKWGYVGGAHIHEHGIAAGSIDEQNNSIRYTLTSQVSPRTLLRFGSEWDRFSFGVLNSSAVPNTLQQISAIVGMDWQFSDRWLFRGEIHPGVYSDFQNVGWNDVDAPALLSAAYLANADLQWFFGLRIDPRSRYPVIPAVGVRWKFADEWTLKAILPEPRLEYEFNDRFSAYIGGSFHAGTFRMSETFGDIRGRPPLNRAMLDYFEVRVGPGFSWRIRPEIEVGASAGCMIYRRFDFSAQHVAVSSDPAPYVQIACQFRF